MSSGSPGRRLRGLQQIDVSQLRGVGERRAQALHEAGITSVLDLLTTYPRRYLDLTRREDLADLAVGDEAAVLAEVRSVHARRDRRGRTLVELVVHDGTGGMHVVFFNQPWRQRQLTSGARAIFYGKLRSYQGRREMANPRVDLVAAAQDGAHESAGRIVAVYPASAKAGLTSWEIGRWVQEALSRAGPLADPLAPTWLRRLDLVDRTESLHTIHRPSSLEAIPSARRRLAFDELLRLQLAVALRRKELERDARGIRHSVDPRDVTPARARGGPPPASLLARFVQGLPFDLTVAQRQALREIIDDLRGPLPMHRLLQGDVGSGKTVVAVATLLAAVQGGHQGALMVPTEVLADQHHAVVRALTGGLAVPDPDRLGGARPLSVALLTSRVPAAERRRRTEGLARGAVDLVVGTHALLTENVRFHSLGAVIIDEQHRFGVEQRAALREKGRQGQGDPDVLVMTATPIPRTAAMVSFGHLDMTILDETPPGRRPVTTVWSRRPEEEAAAWERVRREIAGGRRAYVICPLVEGSEHLQARSAVEERERLAHGVLGGVPLGLLHGQMSSSDKDAAMARFREGSTPVLVSTTVVEVGVDVPEATVIVVEDAERFGIAQLHQLRGRVGRGGAASWCYLLGRAASPEAGARLAALERSGDGFELAEVDLEVRGEGTILGPRQQGPSGLGLASLRRDRDLLEEARRLASAVVGEDPVLERHELLADEVRLVLDEDEDQYLFKS